ncbi:MAG TPA: outer membrane protein [Pseudolabrys sp.]
MRRFASALLTASVLAIGFGQIASAADLPRRQPAYIPPPLPVYTWTGCYVGVNLGGAWGRAEMTDLATGAGVSATNNGFAGGGQIGCDYQLGTFVIGIRNMFDGTSLRGDATFGVGALAGFTGHTQTDWFDTLTARAGYLVQPNWLFYAQGGAAWMRSTQTISSAGAQIAELSNNRTGWTVGGGTEYMFAPHWSVFLEYNYMNFGTTNANFVVGATPVSVDVKRDAQNVLVGVNYKF